MVRSTAPLAPGVEYGWPLAPVPRVARPFDEPPFRYGRGHRGAYLFGAPGQAVLAARAGEVVFVGQVAGRGVVSVQHEDGLRTTYEPVTGTAAVGVRVARGDPIGTLEAGHAGCAEVACLHWGVRRGVRSTSEYLDPLVLLRPRFVRLYPLPAPDEP
ncbi:M23 family metallopeptidase [Pseudonocardia pini]|uniref:M23 family metallopeptidase n=1 Tax=Pseudonocardia pini TaxID=2758030 RepID=UPI0015F0F9B9|nr:M23 family metallopeptidase [Pseudonocardia pini]